MDDLTTTRTEVRCPLGRCPWTYDLTQPRVEHRGDRVVLAVPPPAGVPVAEALAGVGARRPVMAAAAPASFTEVVDVAVRAAHVQDEAVLAAHLRSHPRAELEAELPPAVLAALGIEPPPVTIDLPGGPRLAARWEDDGPASGYRCVVCRTVKTDADDMAGHFRNEHVFVSPGIRGLFGPRG